MIDFVGLELIGFHDLPMTNLVVSFEPRPKLEVRVLLREGGSDDYVETTLVFGELEHINPEVITIEDYTDAEIYSFDYHLQGDFFFGKMIYLLGFGKPSFEIDFSCKTVEIIETKQKQHKT